MKTQRQNQTNVICYIALLLFAIAVVYACKDSSNPVIPIDNNFVYPLAVGNSWDYDVSLKYERVQPDSLRSQINDLIITAKISVTDKFNVNSEEVYKMEESTSSSLTATALYSNRTEGLMKLAYSLGSSSALPKYSGNKRFVFNNFHFNSVEELLLKITGGINATDSLIYFDEPRMILPYPLKVGKYWEVSSPIVVITKEIVGIETITAPFGNYSCFKIRCLYDSDLDGKTDENIVSYEYISKKGLQKFVTIIKNIVLTSATDPDSIGTADIRFEKILKNVNF